MATSWMEQTMDVALAAQVRQWRHRLHAYPELGFGEHETARFVAEVLADLGVSVQTGIGGTGVVGTLTRGSGGRSIGLRADMDGLALDEVGRHDYCSRNRGAMHACGHDGHMAMVLGAAAVLADMDEFEGTVRFVFQPAEEHGRGAQAMLDDGLATRFPMDAIYGLHNLPGVPAGSFQTRPGPIMASEDTFEIAIMGRGGHAARPHMVVDPLVVGAEIVLALQTIVARNVDPQQAAVVSCTEFTTDGVRNAIPGEVIIRGDTRSYESSVQGLLEQRMRDLCTGITQAHGASVRVSYRHEFQPTVNDERCAGVAVQAARRALGSERVDGNCAPIMASEDFGALARAIPGCFAFLGNGLAPGEGGTPLHSRDYDFNDAVLESGVDYYVALVHDVLGSAGAVA